MRIQRIFIIISRIILILLFIVSYSFAKIENNSSTDTSDIHKETTSLTRSKVLIHLELGNIYMRLKKYDKAIEEYELAIKFDPNSAIGAFKNLIFLYLFKNDIKAVKYFKMLEKINPLLAQNIYPAIFNARLYGIREIEGGFLVLLIFLDAEESKDIIDYIKRADAFLDNAKYDKAIDVYKKLLTRKDITSKQRAAVYYNIGMIYVNYMPNMISEGINYIKKAIQFNPDENKFRIGLIEAYRIIKDYPQALQEIDNILREDPNNKFALYAQGVINFKMNRWNEAIKSWDNLKKVDEILFALIEDFYNHAKIKSLE